MKSFDFKGRASKSEYWWFWLFQLVLCVMTYYSLDLDGNKTLNGVLVGVVMASVPANISSMVRRFHDAGFSVRSCIVRILITKGYLLAELI